MATIKAERFTALKERVKAEMLRRCYEGSVAEYGGGAYDYTSPPAAGNTVRQEHRDKLAGPMRAVNGAGIPQSSGAGPVREAELAAMETRVAAWAARSVTDTSGSDCQSGCTGTCYTGCATGCSGCSGCSGCGGCGSGCSGCSGCGDSCQRACSSSCVSSCVEACGSSSTAGSSCSGCSAFCSSSSKY